MKRTLALILALCLLAPLCTAAADGGTARAVIGTTVLFFVIRRVAAPLGNATVPGLKAVDKILGAAFNLLIGLVFVWVVFAIIAAIGDVAAPAKDYLSASKFAGLLYNSNPITTLFTRIFGS